VIVVVGQAKHWRSKVSSSEIQKLLGVMSIRSKRAEVRGMIVCLAGLTAPAEEIIRRAPYPVDVVERDGLVEMLIDTGTGIRRRSLNLESVDDTFWRELSEL